MASSISLAFTMMSENYESLLESGILSDAILVVGKKKLQIHKVILSARSPVFAAMFTNESTKEAQENRVEIIDVDVEVMELLVRYIYTGKVEKLDIYAAELLVAADKYQLNCLKSSCEQQLLYQITTETVSELFILANMHRATELTAKCLDFIIENGTQVMSSEGWKKIVVRADLLAMICELFNLKYSKLTNKANYSIEEETKDPFSEPKLSFGQFD